MFSFVKSQEEGHVFLCKKSRMLSRMFSIVKKEKEGSRERALSGLRERAEKELRKS